MVKKDKAEGEKTEKHTYVKWTEPMKVALALEVFSRRAYKRTDEKMEKKWADIAQSLATNVEFAGIPRFECSNLRTQFKRMAQAVRKEAGVDNQRVNLSAIREEPSQFQKLILDMEEEKDDHKAEASEKKEKTVELQKRLIGHERNAMIGQGKVDHQNSSFQPTTAAEDDDDDNEAVANNGIILVLNHFARFTISTL
jgi:enoyl reductase-like protein